MREGICSSKIIHYYAEYPGVGFYNSKIHETAELMSAFQGLSPCQTVTALLAICGNIW